MHLLALEVKELRVTDALLVLVYPQVMWQLLW